MGHRMGLVPRSSLLQPSQARSTSPLGHTQPTDGPWLQFPIQGVPLNLQGSHLCKEHTWKSRAPESSHSLSQVPQLSPKAFPSCPQSTVPVSGQMSFLLHRGLTESGPTSFLLPLFFPLFLGHTQQCSKVTPGSILGNYS